MGPSVMLRGCFYLDRAMRSPFCALLRARGLSKKTQLDPGAETSALRHLEIERGRTLSFPEEVC